MAFKIRYKILGEERDDKPVIRQVTIKAKTKQAAQNELSERIRTQNSSGRVINIRKTRRGSKRR